MGTVTSLAEWKRKRAQERIGLAFYASEIDKAVAKADAALTRLEFSGRYSDPYALRRALHSLRVKP